MHCKRGGGGVLAAKRTDLWDELSWQVGLGNVGGVVGREMVARQAERARPHLGGKVHLAAVPGDG